MVPATKAAGPSKRGPENQGVRDKARRAPSTVEAPEAEQMDDAPIPLALDRKKAGKRRASEEAKDEYQTGGEKKGPRLNHPTIDAVEVGDPWMSRLEAEEKKTIHIATEDHYMPMTVIEETMDISWMEGEKTKILGEMIGCTDVGPVGDRLGERLIQYVAEEFINSLDWICPAG